MSDTLADIKNRFEVSWFVSMMKQRGTSYDLGSKTAYTIAGHYLCIVSRLCSIVLILPNDYVIGRKVATSY